MIRGLVRLGATNPVLINIVFVVVCLAGVLSWRLLPKEQFPQVSTDRVVVIVGWPGAAPEDVEDLVLRPVEDALEDVDGIKHVFGEANSGYALVTLEFVRGVKADEALSDVEQAVAEIGDFPEDVLTPRVDIAALRIPVINVGLLGDTRQVDLAERLSEELSGLSGVQQTDIAGQSTRVVRVDLYPERLEVMGLTPSDVAQQIRRQGVAMPAGDLFHSGQEVVVRTPQRLRDMQDIATIPIGSDGLVVGDLGRVIEEWEAPNIVTHVNGQPAIVLTLYGDPGADILKTVPSVREWVEQRNADLPSGLTLKTYDDSAVLVSDRLRTVTANAAIGLVLVFLFLTTFIGLRNGLLVIWGMPVAYLGAIALMKLTGTTVNVISTFALLLVTGVIVDDAVIIVENVQRHLERGKARLAAAVDGTAEVIGPVFASTLTTCLAFAPLLMLDGTVGRVMSIIPTVVIFSLIASLVEAYFILPGHLAHYAAEARSGENRPTRWLKRVFEPLVTWVTRPVLKYVSVVALMVVFASVMSLTLFMRTTLTTEGQPYFVLLNLDLAPGVEDSQTRGALQRLEAVVAEETAGLSDWYVSTTGQQIDPNDFPATGSRYGQMKVGFYNQQSVFDEVPNVLAKIREHLEQDLVLESYAIETLRGGPPSGRDIDVSVRSRQPEDVLPLVYELREFLGQQTGVFDIRDESTQGNWELRIDVDLDQAGRFGLTQSQIASAARAAMDGDLAVELPIGERSTEVRVGLLGTEQLDRAGLEAMAVMTPSGSTVRLSQVAEIHRVRGIERINRVDGQRAVRVSALVDPLITTPESVKVKLDGLFSGISEQYPAAELFYGGRLEDSAESFRSLPSIFMLAIFMIYGVLAVQFRSYLQPFIILSAVPLGLAGVVLGLFILRMDLSLIALIGAVGLVGIVVNDSLVLIDFINRRRGEGEGAREAVIGATLTRLRPILITTVTTVLGLAPLGLGLAGKEPLLAPMAVSIGFGLAFATSLTLVAVPVFYLVTDDVSRLAANAMARIRKKESAQLN